MRFTTAALALLLGASTAAMAQANLRGAVDAAVQPTMRQYDIPGLAVAIHHRASACTSTMASPPARAAWRWTSTHCSNWAR